MPKIWSMFFQVSLNAKKKIHIFTYMCISLYTRTPARRNFPQAPGPPVARWGLPPSEPVGSGVGFLPPLVLHLGLGVGKDRRPPMSPSCQVFQRKEGPRVGRAFAPTSVLLGFSALTQHAV